MQVLDSLIDGPLELGNVREGNELIGAIVRYLRTGAEPEPRTDSQRMALTMVRPVLEKSRARIVAGSEGGSKPTSKRTSKAVSKMTSKADSNTESKETTEETSKARSDIYSSSYTPDSPSKGEGCGEGEIPFDAIVAALNDAAGTAYRPSSRKTRRWRGDARMGAYLRPETLFGPKFEGYRELARAAASTPGGGASGDEYSRL